MNVVNGASHTYEMNVWLAPEELATLASFSYWNDREVELRKAAYNLQVPFHSIERYEGHQGRLLRQLVDLDLLSGGALAGRGISLAAGSCWLEALILARYPRIEKLTCLEFSKPRIFEFAPHVLAKREVEPARIELCLGSFYDIKVPDASMDFVILCQAFHHADDPKRVLGEVRRILKPSGKVFMLGEHYFPVPLRLMKQAKFVVKWFLNHKSFRAEYPSPRPVWKAMFPDDPVKGDHHYSMEQYREFFRDKGFQWEHHRWSKAGLQGFVLWRG